MLVEWIELIRLVVGLVLFALAFFHVFTGVLGIIAYVCGWNCIGDGDIWYSVRHGHVFGINTRAAKTAK